LPSYFVRLIAWPARTRLQSSVLEFFDAFLAVVSFVGQRGYVIPAESFDEVDQGLGLIGVGRNDAREVLEPCLVTQFHASRSIADLRYLK